MKKIVDWVVNQLNAMPLWDMVSHFILLMALATWYVIMIWKRKEFFEDTRGKDKIWQFIEWSGVFWMTFTPPMLIASLFGMKFEDEAWSFMEIVFFINILGKSSQRFIEARFGVSSVTSTKSTTEHVTIKEQAKPAPDEGSNDSAAS